MKGLVLVLAVVGALLVTCGAAGKCRGVRCDVPRCVDPVMAEGACCAECPNGENCWSDEKVIPAGQNVIRPIGSGCSALCRCPGASVYSKNGEGTRAVCRFWCTSGGISQQFLQKQYSNWGKKKRFSGGGPRAGRRGGPFPGT